MTLMQILEEEEREEFEMDLEREQKRKNVFVRFLIGFVKNILNTLERK